jgi:hypothetical protein
MKYRVEVREAVFKVCFVKIHPTLILSRILHVAEHPVIYQFKDLKLNVSAFPRAVYL